MQPSVDKFPPVILLLIWSSFNMMFLVVEHAGIDCRSKLREKIVECLCSTRTKFILTICYCLDDELTDVRSTVKQSSFKSTNATSTSLFAMLQLGWTRDLLASACYDWILLCSYVTNFWLLLQYCYRLHMYHVYYCNLWFTLALFL